MSSTLTTFFHELRKVRHEAARDDLQPYFVQEASRVFPARLLKKREQSGDKLRVVLHFHGLLGNLGTLPDYFTDEVLHYGEEACGLQDFIEMFNHRCLELFFRAWRRSQIMLENNVAAKDPTNGEIDAFLQALGGLAMEPDQDRSDLLHPCLLRHHMALFQRKDKTLLGLRNLLRSFFPSQSFHFEEHVEQWIRIPENQRACLGSGLSIGRTGNFLVGTQTRDLSGRFNLLVRQLDFQTYLSFMPGGQHHVLLCQILRLYTQNHWHTALLLELRKEEIPPMQLGMGTLGASLWALSGPAAGDARVNLGVLQP